MLDLKGKVEITDESQMDLLQPTASQDESQSIVKEALLALEALGYSKRELKKVEKN